jgi:diguanylate cyclase (GGDEF)-like protein
MRSTARDTDAVARFGGDEFVIALPDTTWDGAMTFAERLRARVSECTFGSMDVAVGTTVSIGVALAHGMDPVGPETLLTDADTALYRAKTAGRNRVFS